jgi:hypothetical protein
MLSSRTQGEGCSIYLLRQTADMMTQTCHQAKYQDSVDLVVSSHCFEDCRDILSY